MRPLPLFLLLAGCPADPGVFTVVAEEQPEALLSVRGSGTGDVWAVGGDVGDGPAVLHWDGSDWSDLDTGTSGDLWWVFLDGTDTVWMVGAGGRVIEHDRTGGTFTEEVLDADVTFFGIWGGGDGVLWAVGGAIESGDGAALWRHDTSGWTEETVPSPADEALALYKVWGSAAGDAWICGVDGVLLHWNGSDWSTAESPTTRALFTVHGTGSGAAYAVGGSGNAALLEWDGDKWTDDSPQFAPQLNGVYARGGDVVAVGRQGAVWWRGEEGWEVDPRDPPTDLDFHAAWLDPDGALWAVGGSLSSTPLDRGLLVYDGETPPSPITATR